MRAARGQRHGHVTMNVTLIYDCSRTLSRVSTQGGIVGPFLPAKGSRAPCVVRAGCRATVSSGRVSGQVKRVALPILPQLVILRKPARGSAMLNLSAKRERFAQELAAGRSQADADRVIAAAQGGGR
jgi:hypothetical protein